jgi:hypothetical protein
MCSTPRFSSSRSWATHSVFGLSLLCLCLFFAKRRAFRRFYIILLVVNAGFLLVDELASNQIPYIGEESHGSSDRSLYRAVIQAIIWC